MTYVVTEPCIGCRYGECVKVCPVEAFHEGPNFVVINPLVCINCAICELVCPVGAIAAEADLDPGKQDYLRLNEDLSKRWPIALSVEPLAEADRFAQEVNKRQLLELPG